MNFYIKDSPAIEVAERNFSCLPEIVSRRLPLSEYRPEVRLCAMSRTRCVDFFTVDIAGSAEWLGR
jgi:hypothetical protein